MINIDDPKTKCPICGATVIAFVREPEQERDKVGWACGAVATSELRLSNSHSFPDGKYTVYRAGIWSVPTGCRNAETVVRNLRAEAAKSKDEKSKSEGRIAL